MTGFITNIEKDTVANEDFRRVLFTGPHTQLVLMTLRPGKEIGEHYARLFSARLATSCMS